MSLTTCFTVARVQSAQKIPRTHFPDLSYAILSNNPIQTSPHIGFPQLCQPKKSSAIPGGQERACNLPAKSWLSSSSLPTAPSLLSSVITQLSLFYSPSLYPPRRQLVVRIVFIRSKFSDSLLFALNDQNVFSLSIQIILMTLYCCFKKPKSDYGVPV